jgi:hypothetical protein
MERPPRWLVEDGHRMELFHPIDTDDDLTASAIVR